MQFCTTVRHDTHTVYACACERERERERQRQREIELTFMRTFTACLPFVTKHLYPHSKAKLHQCQTFCSLSVVRSHNYICALNSNSKYYTTTLKDFVTLKPCEALAAINYPFRLMNRGWKYPPQKSRRGWRYPFERYKLGSPGMALL